MAKKKNKKRRRSSWKKFTPEQHNYHSLILDMQAFCQSRGFSFIQGMSIAIKEWMSKEQSSQKYNN